ncbi:unnamed protein product [Mytilus edulis]|uniref:Tudor domain-containing protein n=1 Tax=Mytilus edulis TaxID=6550 RepID=A0A8S3S286_MYTED|nr:unnamed protein product [Mytilus edulis]
MSGSERWKIMIENGRLCVEENGRYFEDIDNVGTTREFGIIKVTYESGKAKMYSLKNLCEGLGFGPAVKTRSGFMKIWDSLKANVDNYQLQTSSTDNIDQSENQVNMNISDVPGGEDLTSTDDNVNTLDNVQRKSSTQISPVQKKLLSPMDSSEDASTVEDILERSVSSCTEAHINTEDASDSTPVTVEQSILDDYLIGDALKVHIQNLVIPADDRCFRNLDTKHAHCLKQFYENQQMCHTILIGNIVSDVTTDKGNLSKFLQEPGKVAVETLGGNHTRHALQCLFASQTKPISMVTCRLYNKLPDELALQLGYEHNASNTLGKPTSFVDLVKMFRKEATKIVGDTDISCMQSSEVKQWKDIICTILGMDRKAEEFHNKYKIVLKIAKSKDSVWRKFLEFCSAFEMNEIRNTPRGSLKITQLRDFSMLSSDNQIHILEETLQTKDWRVFKREVESVSSDRKKTIGKTKADPSDVDRKINENECKIKQLTAEREKLATTSSTLKSKLTEEQKKTEDFETLLNQERKKCSALEIKLQQLRRSENELKVVLDKQIDKNEKSSNLLQVEKTKYQTLEEMYNKLEEAKACLEKKVQEFEESIRCQHTEKHTSQVNYSIVSGRDLTPKQKLKNDCSHSDNLNKKKRRMSSKEFEVGTSVEAFWYPDKCWYTAKILMKTGKGYEVKYDLDKFVKDLPLKYVRAEKISTE